MRSTEATVRIYGESRSDSTMKRDDFIINSGEKILVTGANGFIGTRVVNTLLEYGFGNIRCLIRPTGSTKALMKILEHHQSADVDVFKGNLLSSDDCVNMVTNVSVVYHLAAGVEKTFPGCFMNSVVTTRNLLDAVRNEQRLKRFLNVSSFAVYDPSKLRKGDLLDEACEVENKPHLRGDAYCFGKVKQEELLVEYGERYDIPYVIVRPGAVYGPGKNAITGRVGIDTFGIFLHMGGSNQIPFTHVDNCAEAIILAGLKRNLDGEVFNIVDDNLPESRKFLRMYKKNVRSFRSVGIHRSFSYLLSLLWEKYSYWSDGQLPLAFNRRRWAAEWKGCKYSNAKLKRLTGWHPRIPTEEGMKSYFDFAKESGKGQ
jgi:nucleoside-diphosphate-sugar epimerase